MDMDSTDKHKIKLLKLNSHNSQQTADITMNPNGGREAPEWGLGEGVILLFKARAIKGINLQCDSLCGAAG